MIIGISIVHRGISRIVYTSKRWKGGTAVSIKDKQERRRFDRSPCAIASLINEMRVARCSFSQTEYRIAEKIGVDRLPLGEETLSKFRGLEKGAASIFEQSGESATSSSWPARLRLVRLKTLPIETFERLLSNRSEKTTAGGKQ